MDDIMVRGEWFREWFRSLQIDGGGILRSLLQHASSNSPNCGRTLLHHAILCGNVEAVRTLLECGADPESPNVTNSVE
ncbi:unnamed protein product [Lupinus luteus]|uniref:Uncharacterized protein n=1 Tax=Lupinus luteus TaxID=3873 RepID=A0AAV1X9Y4_LUPLU